MASNNLTFDEMQKVMKHKRLLKKFVSLTRKKRGHEAKLKELNKELELIGKTKGEKLGSLLQIFIDSRVKKIPGVSGMTISQKREVFASPAKDHEGNSKEEELIKALKANDFKEYVSEKFNGKGFGAFLKEKMDALDDEDISTSGDEPFVPPDPDDVIPKELKGLLVVTEKFSLVGRES